MRFTLTMTVLVLFCASMAWATPFPTSGGVYLGNVAAQHNNLGGWRTSATASYAGGASSASNPSVLIDSLATDGPLWTVTGLNADGAIATATVDLGQVWDLSRIYTTYGNWGTTTGISYQLNVSTDGIAWNTVSGPSAVGSSGGRPENLNNFSTTSARYIQWQVIGSASAPASLGMNELLAYVSSTAATAPQQEEGYNIARGLTTGSVISNTFNSPGWFTLGGLFDGVFNNDGGLLPDLTPGQTAVIDLGASFDLARLSVDMYGSWDNGELAISNDNLLWTVVKGPGVMSTSTYELASPVTARYVQIVGHTNTGGKLQEIQVFASPTPLPEPSTAALLSIGTLILVRRNRR